MAGPFFRVRDGCVPGQACGAVRPGAVGPGAPQPSSAWSVSSSSWPSTVRAASRSAESVT